MKWGEGQPDAQDEQTCKVKMLQLPCIRKGGFMPFPRVSG